MVNVASIKLISVSGCGQSGTTLIATIFGAHSESFLVPYETGWFLKNQVQQAEKSFIAAAEQDRKYVIEKTPRHLYFQDEIKTSFPNFFSIVMIRNAIDLVGSLTARTGDFNKSLNRVALDLDQSLKISRNDNTFILKYESLIEDPERHVRNICSLIGMPFESNMMEYYKNSPKWFQKTKPLGQGEKMHIARRAEQVTKPIFDARGSGIKHLDPQQLKTSENKLSDIMKALGY
jgi:hypothetical protein